MADPPAWQAPSRSIYTNQERGILIQLKVFEKIKDLGITSFRGFSMTGLAVVDQPELVISLISTCARVELDHATVGDDKRLIVIRLRQAAERGAMITVVPGISIMNSDEQSRLQQFTKTTSLESAPIAAVTEKAKLFLEDVTNGRLTDDALLISIWGPSIPELTIASIPSPEPEPSRDFTTEDIQALRKITRFWTEETDNILLVLASATSDYEQQKPWRLAKQLDPSLEKTMGILTRIEQLEPGSEREAVSMLLMKDTQGRLGHGWYALCDEAGERNTRSASENAPPPIVEKEPWSSIQRNRFGLRNIVKRLEAITASRAVECALDQLESSADQLRTEIAEKILEKGRAMVQLGEARTTTPKQKDFLLHVTERFSRLTEQALNGVYLDDFFKGPPFDAGLVAHDVRKLRNVLGDFSLQFSEAMLLRGCSRHVIGLTCPGFLAVDRSNPYIGDCEIHYSDRKALEAEVTKDLRENGFFQLPGSVMTPAARLFQRQSVAWEVIARGHLLNVWQILRYFVFCALRSIMDAETARRIMDVIVDPRHLKIKDQLLKKLEEFSKCLRQEHLSTAGVDFLARTRAQGTQLLDQHVQDANSNSLSPSEIIEQMQMYYDASQSCRAECRLILT